MRIGIDIGGTHIAFGIVTKEGKVLQKQERDWTQEEKESLEEVIEPIFMEQMERLLKKANKSIEEIEAIGIGFPGITKDGKFVSAHNLKVQNYPITQVLHNYYSVPICLKNDAKCATIAEKRFGSLKPYENSMFITIGTGIGGGVIWKDQLLEPKEYPGFEIGHMIIQKGGELCNCGNKGCFERYASIQALKRKVQEQFSIKGTLTGKQLLQYIQKHIQQEQMQEVLQEYLENLSIGLGNLITIFQPEAIAIGGSFPFYKEILFSSLQEKIKPYLKQEKTKFLLAELKNDAGIIGAGVMER